MAAVTHLNETKFNKTDWKDTFNSWRHLKQDAKRKLLELYKTAKLNGPALDVDVITLNGNPAKLLDYSCDPNRPLVVNFGSCT